MPCFYPLAAYRINSVNPDTGKNIIVFNPSQKQLSKIIDNLELPCGQCIGCRLERSRQWAIRCVHEASLHEKNCFITLTYNNKNLPENGSLDKSHFQKFMKRLRKAYPNEKIKFFHCGEYGEKKGRPHYHACLFGFDFPDKTQFRTTDAGFPVFRSKNLEQLWIQTDPKHPEYGKSMGYSEIGTVTFESAAYVARYITKKVNGPLSFDHYNTINYNTGEILQERIPEYTTMSRGGRTGKGIAADWYEQYKTESIENDFIIIMKNGQPLKCKIPRYYDNRFEIENPELFAKLKQKRKEKAEQNLDNSPDRLKVKEQIQNINAQKLIRSFEQNPYAEELQNAWEKEI